MTAVASITMTESSIMVVTAAVLQLRARRVHTSSRWSVQLQLAPRPLVVQQARLPPAWMQQSFANLAAPRFLDTAPALLLLRQQQPQPPDLEAQRRMLTVMEAAAVLLALVALAVVAAVLAVVRLRLDRHHERAHQRHMMAESGELTILGYEHQVAAAAGGTVDASQRVHCMAIATRHWTHWQQRHQMLPQVLS